jgi:hypothetical protein
MDFRQCRRFGALKGVLVKFLTQRCGLDLSIFFRVRVRVRVRVPIEIMEEKTQSELGLGLGLGHEKQTAYTS